MIELLGALFLIGLPLSVGYFVYHKHKYYKGELRKDIKPDLVSAALLHKQIASGQLVVKVNKLKTIGR